MIQIIWGVLNMAILIYFFIICIKSVKVIREKLGFPATLIFVFGFLSFMARPDSRDIETETVNLQHPESNEHKFQGNTYRTEVQLENNLASEIHLWIIHRENATGKILLSAGATRSGLVSGTNWSVKSISIDKSANSTGYTYAVSGLLDWRILGITIYSEMKDYNGKTELKDKVSG